MKLLKNKIIVFLLSIAPFLLWSVLSLTIMKSYIDTLWVVLVLILGLLLSICMIMNKSKAKILGFIILVVFTLYFIYEGMKNSVFGFAYPAFLVLYWLYYIVLYIMSRKK